ncbi:MAG TPA: iron-containing alcohol dehydrogenase family protein [Micromonosporaceae bacterium]|jgi:glycerol-1-phosphate dehydrogenase [NAD(P)+]
MPLLARTILTPLTIEISDGALDRLGTVVADARISGGELAVVLGPGIGPQLVDRVRVALPSADILTIEPGSQEAALALADQLRTNAYDTVVGIGGGKVLDTVKYASMLKGMPMIAVATSLAHDGLASPISTLTRDGISHSYGVQTPIAVLVDLGLVLQSPDDQLRGGIGDTLSDLSAIADWQLSHELTGEPIDGLAIALARTGADAIINHTGTIEDVDFIATLANSLILGGLAMNAAGSSRPTSGACHEIWHAMSMLHPGQVSHGFGVGVGALFATFLRTAYDGGRGCDLVGFDRLSAALARHGLPRVPSEIGLTPEQFAAAINFAPATRPGRFTILEHLALDAGAIATAVKEYIDAIG